MKRSKLLPDFAFKRVWEITPEFLQKQNISSLIVDLDNTLARADHPDPWPGVHEWLELMDANGIKIIILSNNTKKRILSFLHRYDYDYISMASKPIGFNFYRAIKKVKTPKNKVAMVGDQIFTDVLGANIYGIKSILVEPFEVKGEGGFLFQMKRKIEIKYLEKYKEGLNKNI